MAFVFAVNLTKGDEELSEIEEKIIAMRWYVAKLEFMPLPDDIPQRAGAVSFREFMRVSLTDMERKQRGLSGDRQHLKNLKAGIAAAGESLHHAYCTRASELRGWRYGLPAQNPTQALAGVINELILNAAASIVEIEESYPHLKEHFQRVRDERAHLDDQPSHI